MGRHWGRNGLGTNLALVLMNYKENTMGRMKDIEIGLQNQEDQIDESMTQAEIDDTIDQIMKDEADAQDRLHKAQRRLSFWKGFMTGWAFVVILDLISYFY